MRWIVTKKKIILAGEMTRPNWSELFVETTLLFAKRSSCLKTQQAALLVKDNRIISFGINGSPAGHINCSEYSEAICGKDSNGSCFLGIHAEQNAIGYAARNGINTNDCVVYCTQSPCISCAKLVVAAGIKEFYYISNYRLVDGIKFLEQAGVSIKRIKK